MESTFTVSAATLGAAQAHAARQATAWQVRTPYVGAWLARATQLLGQDTSGRVVLCYDVEDHLLSFDVFDDDRRVFGMDDFV